MGDLTNNPVLSMTKGQNKILAGFNPDGTAKFAFTQHDNNPTVGTLQFPDVVITPKSGTVDKLGNVYNNIGGARYMTALSGRRYNIGEIPVSNVDPLAKFYVEGTALAPAFKLIKPIYNLGKSIKNNGGFSITLPYMGNKLGKITGWIPTNRSITGGISWISTGSPTIEGVPIKYITSKYPGEGKKLYDIAIKNAIKSRHKGIITGTDLVSAPKTYNMLEHYYPSKVLLNNNGRWSNSNMVSKNNTENLKDVVEGWNPVAKDLKDFLTRTKNNPDKRLDLFNAPVYRLEKPSTKVQTEAFKLDQSHLDYLIK